MKTTITLLFVLAFTFSGYTQSKSVEKKSQNIQIVTEDEGFTSELLPITVATPPNLTGAKIGIKYFGIKSESDISFVLMLKGTKSDYSSGATFGIRFFVDGLPFRENSYRAVQDVVKSGAEEILRFYLSTEDLAWLATGEKLSIAIFNTETGKKHDTVVLNAANFKEFKDFVKSVYLLRSQIE